MMHWSGYSSHESGTIEFDWIKYYQLESFTPDRASPVQPAVCRRRPVYGKLKQVTSFNSETLLNAIDATSLKVEQKIEASKSIDASGSELLNHLLMLDDSVSVQMYWKQGRTQRLKLNQLMTIEDPMRSPFSHDMRTLDCFIFKFASNSAHLFSPLLL